MVPPRMTISCIEAAPSELETRDDVPSAYKFKYLRAFNGLLNWPLPYPQIVPQRTR
jgi:hypothetical protein